MGFANVVKGFNQKYNPFLKIEDLQKQIKTMMIPASIGRPAARATTFTDAYPNFPYQEDVLNFMARYSATITTIHMALKRETFRNGFEVSPAEKTDIETLSAGAGVDDDSRPEDEIKAEIVEKLRAVNEDNDTAKDVMKQLEDDLNTVDRYFCLFLSDYTFDIKGEISEQDLREVLRVDPATMQLVKNKDGRTGYNDNNEVLMVCPEHRGTTHAIKDEVARKEKQYCPKCGKRMYKACYLHEGQQSIYYFNDEIIYQNRYRKGGFSPIMTVWQETKILTAQNTYMRELYEGKRPPKGLLVFNTPNRESLKVAWKEMIERAKENPHLPAIMGLSQDGKTGKKVAEFFDFMRGLDELQFTEFREELGRKIGGVFGVQPIWQGDMSTSGGLNNEGLQITVNNRTIEDNQAEYNDKLLSHWIKKMGYPTWVWKLNPSEEQDEMAKQQKLSQALANAEIALKNGLEVEYDDKTMEVHIKSGFMKKPEMPAFGAFGNDSSEDKEESDEEPEVEGTPDIDTDSQEGSPEKQKKKLISNETNKTLVGRSAKSQDINSPGVEAVNKASKEAFSPLLSFIKKQLNKFVKVGKRPSEKKMMEMIKALRSDLSKELSGHSDRFFKKVYNEMSDKVGKELGVNFTFDKIDENAIDYLTHTQELQQAFSGLSENTAKKIHEIIVKAYNTPEGLSNKEIIKQIQEVSGVAQSRAENIARTETGKVSAAARKISYRKADPQGEFLYKHIGPNDYRTTKVSERIKRRTAKGVSWNDYVNIIKEESKKEFPEWTVDENAPMSHYQSRHTFLKVQ